MPKQFKVTDGLKILEFINKFPLGMVVCVHDNEPIINHLPFTSDGNIEQGGRMFCHVARANSIWRKFSSPEGTLATVVFSGPSAYITPSWYAEKQTTHKVVPTYAYCTVHVKGVLKFTDVEAEKLNIVTKLTTHFEDLRENPWQVSDAPDDFIKSQIRAIVGCTFDITSVTAKWKANQNHTDENRNNVTEGLEAESASGANGGDALSGLMAKEFRCTITGGCPMSAKSSCPPSHNNASDQKGDTLV